MDCTRFLRMCSNEIQDAVKDSGDGCTFLQLSKSGVAMVTESYNGKWWHLRTFCHARLQVGCYNC